MYICMHTHTYIYIHTRTHVKRPVWREARSKDVDTREANAVSGCVTRGTPALFFKKEKIVFVSKDVDTKI